MAFSRSWGNHIKPCALTVTSTYLIFKLPLACTAGGKVIVFGHHHKVLDGIQQKLGKAYQAMRIDGSTSLHCEHHASCVQQYSCMHRRRTRPTKSSPQGARQGQAHAGQCMSGHVLWQQHQHISHSNCHLQAAR